jgi:hypothetical protein
MTYDFCPLQRQGGGDLGGAGERPSASCSPTGHTWSGRSSHQAKAGRRTGEGSGQESVNVETGKGGSRAGIDVEAGKGAGWRGCH